MKSYLILFLAFLPAAVFGLKCYVCQHLSPGKVDADCRDAKPNKLQSCPDPSFAHPSLQKHIIVNGMKWNPTDGKPIKYFCSHSIIQADGVEYIGRGCEPNIPDRWLPYNEDEDGVTGETFSCSTDGCNNKKGTLPTLCSSSLESGNSTVSKKNLKAFLAKLLTLQSRLNARFSALTTPPFKNRPMFKGSVHGKML